MYSQREQQVQQILYQERLQQNLDYYRLVLANGHSPHPPKSSLHSHITAIKSSWQQLLQRINQSHTSQVSPLS